MTPAAATSRVMVKVGNHWIHGTPTSGPYAGHVTFDPATAAHVEASAIAHGHHAYAAPAHQQATNEHEDRAHIVSAWRWGVAHEPEIHYPHDDVRTTPVVPALQAVPLTIDCSEFFTGGYRWSHLDDPNGNHYAGPQFTGTLLEHCLIIPLHLALPGDGIVYGPGSGSHVVGIDTIDGNDPWVISHGQEKGPVKIRHSAEVSAHGGGPVRVIRSPQFAHAA